MFYQNPEYYLDRKEEVLTIAYNMQHSASRHFWLSIANFYDKQAEWARREREQISPHDFTY